MITEHLLSQQVAEYLNQTPRATGQAETAWDIITPQQSELDSRSFILRVGYPDYRDFRVTVEALW